MLASPGVRPADRLACPVIKVEIRRQLAAIRAGHAYQGADHAAETVVKEPGLRVVLIALKDGGRLREHRAHSSLTVQALEGLVHFTAADRTVDLTPGRLLAVGAGVPHQLEAVGESAVLLTMGGS